jgi:hypothetical protein
LSKFVAGRNRLPQRMIGKFAVALKVVAINPAEISSGFGRPSD